jgi:hypothetical protein
MRLPRFGTRCNEGKQGSRSQDPKGFLIWRMYYNCGQRNRQCRKSSSGCDDCRPHWSMYGDLSRRHTTQSGFNCACIAGFTRERLQVMTADTREEQTRTRNDGLGNSVPASLAEHLHREPGFKNREALRSPVASHPEPRARRQPARAEGTADFQIRLIKIRIPASPRRAGLRTVTPGEEVNPHVRSVAYVLPVECMRYPR